MTAAAGSRIATSDDEIHSLTFEGPSCGGFSRPAAARTGYVVLRIEPGGHGRPSRPWRASSAFPTLTAYSDEFRHRFQFKPTTPSDSNPQLFPIRFRHPTSMPSSEHHQRRVVHGGGRASLTTNARPPRWATRVQRAGCSCRPSPAPFSLNSILSRSESVISLPSSSCAWASSIRRPVRCGGRH